MKTTHDDKTMISHLSQALQYVDNHKDAKSEGAKQYMMRAIFLLVLRSFGKEKAERLLKEWG